MFHAQVVQYSVSVGGSATWAHLSMSVATILHLSRTNNNTRAWGNKLPNRLMAQVLARLIYHDKLVHLFSSVPVPGCLIDDELPVDG